MPVVTFIAFDGTALTVAAQTGKSLMQAAIDNSVPGIDADCGGGCACGTCHVFVDESWLARCGAPGAAEQGMLGMRPDRMPGSRLSCQIAVVDALDGLVVRLPEYQM